MTKKSSKEFKSVDTISKDLDIVDNFVLRNWKRYTYIAIGIVVVVAALLMYYESRATSSVKEAQEIITAQTIPELQDVIKKYPSSESVDFSRLDLAAKYFNAKEYDKAVAAYKDEISNGKDSSAINLAKLYLCYAVTQTNGAEGVADFKKIADNSDMPEYIRAEAAYAAGVSLLSANDKSEAIKYLKLCISFKNSKGWDKSAQNLINTNS